MNGNPHVMEWRAVDCPVGDKHKLEYLMCTPGTCNAEDTPDVRKEAGREGGREGGRVSSFRWEKGMGGSPAIVKIVNFFPPSLLPSLPYCF